MTWVCVSSFLQQLVLRTLPVNCMKPNSGNLRLCYHWFYSSPEKNREQICVCNCRECSTTLCPKFGGCRNVLAAFLDKWWTAPETESNRFLVPVVLPSNMSMFSGWISFPCCRHPAERWGPQQNTGIWLQAFEVAGAKGGSKTRLAGGQHLWVLWRLEVSKAGATGQ